MLLRFIFKKKRSETSKCLWPLVVDSCYLSPYSSCCLMCLKHHQSALEFSLCSEFSCRYSSNTFLKEQNTGTSIFIQKKNTSPGCYLSAYAFTHLWKDFLFLKKTIFL